MYKISDRYLNKSKSDADLYIYFMESPKLSSVVRSEGTNLYVNTIVRHLLNYFSIIVYCT